MWCGYITTPCSSSINSQYISFITLICSKPYCKILSILYRLLSNYLNIISISYQNKILIPHSTNLYLCNKIDISSSFTNFTDDRSHFLPCWNAKVHSYLMYIDIFTKASKRNFIWQLFNSSRISCLYT